MLDSGVGVRLTAWLLLLLASSAASAVVEPTEYRYSCNLTAFPVSARSSSPSLPADLEPSARLARSAIQAATTVTNTSYTHISDIDGTRGIYHTDCSCLVSYLLDSSGLTKWLDDIPKDAEDAAVNPPMPRAKEFARFAISLATLPDHQARARWTSVPRLWDIQEGDIIAWEIPNYQAQSKSTGHVLVVTNPSLVTWRSNQRMIYPLDDGEPRIEKSALVPVNATAAWVSVVDASSTRHQWDSRCSGFPHHPCARGVGHGFVLLSENADGHIQAFMFREDATPRYHPIGIARLKGAV
ncbi:hypothetical protein HDU85_004129 [Gaertneriomyces sp. JEL0708]|nr:hypothetical protein HDU85_004129 [Gaertneriomyces sp. JEL0708]